MSFSEYSELPLETLLHHLRAEIGQNPFVGLTRPELSRRRRALAAPLDDVLRTAEGEARVHAVVVDVGFPGGAVSLVVTEAEVALEFPDGTVLTGGGDDLSQLEREMFGKAGECLRTAELTSFHSLPESGRAKIWVRTSEALLVAVGGERELIADSHELADVYRVGLRLMAAVLEGEE